MLDEVGFYYGVIAAHSKRAQRHWGAQHKKKDNKIKSIEIKDLDEVKLINTNEDTKRVDIEENYTSFVYSESKLFDEFLWESFDKVRQNI